MIRNLLATTAIATLVSTGAFAQETTTPAPAEQAPVTQDASQPAPAADAGQTAPMAKAEGHLASNIIGENVYNGTADDAEKIGDVNDIVLSPEGQIQAVIVGVGGFLGIGEKNVAVEYSQLEWVERDGDRWLVAPTTKEQLESQTAFDTSAYEPAPAEVAVSDPMAPATEPAAPATDMAQDPAAPAADQAAPATDVAQDPAAPAAEQTAQDPAPADTATQAEAPVAGSTDTTATAAIDRSTLTEMPSGDIRAEEMIGTTVYGADDANVGEIGDVILTADGAVDAYIIDVGGFLGMGEKEVAVGTDNLAFMTDKDGNKYLYTSFTKEQLDAAAAYDKDSYAEKRDDQRIIMTK